MSPFHFDYYSPNKEKPFLKVSKIEGGYRFERISEKGETISDFSLHEGIVENRYEATGYQGEDGQAIEQFRQFLYRFS